MKRAIVIVVVAIVAALMSWTPAQAASCPPSSVGGTPTAWITVGKTIVPVKNITYRNGGALDPPHTNQAAGISVRQASLTAKKGNTVITWHVRWGYGCNGTLNPVLSLPTGHTFMIKKPGGQPMYFAITKREIVKHGVVKPAWFATRGTHQIVLITCGGLQGNTFTKTQVLYARQVPGPVPVPVPDPTTAVPVPADVPSGGVPPMRPLTTGT